MIMKHLAIGFAVLLATSAFASGDATLAPLTPVYKKECGSCHAPFPPALLGAADWKKTMAGLEKHFGTDASLDAGVAHEISAWLERNAGRGVGASTSVEPRLTATRWFVREHDEVPARVWKDSRVKTPANCGACHKGADQGRYGERELVVPGMARRHERD
jgi:hypothetical protein